MNCLPRPARNYAAAALASLALAPSGHALAAIQDATNKALTFEDEQEVCTVNRDGTYSDIFEITIRVNAQRGLADAAQRSIHYNHATTRVDVLSAYTRKADGRVLKVDAASIRDQQDANSINAPQFNDQRNTTIIFPDVAVGDRVFYRVRYARSVPLMAGQFSDLTVMEQYQVRHYSIAYDLPDDMPLRADNRGFRAAPPLAAGGRKIYHWDYSGNPAPRREADSVNALDDGDRLFVSTFASYAALAEAYQTAAAKASAATPAIEAKAKEIVAKSSTERARALAILGWVRGNIRPIDNALDAGNQLAPHMAEQVLASRYGDARDHVALAQAMLSSVGIASTPALLNAGGMYTIPDAPSIEALYHAILYLPKLEAYADTTDRGVRDFYLPMSELDKAVLLTASGQLARTPIAQRARTQIDSDVKVAADGSADYAVNANFYGVLAEQNRGPIRGMTETDQQSLVQRLLAEQGLAGSGSFDDLGDRNGNGDRYLIKYRAHVDDYAAFPGTAGSPSDGSLLHPIANAVGALRAEKTRVMSFVCAPQDIEEETRYELAPELALVALPPATFVHDDYFDYTADYRRDGSKLSVKRRLLVHHGARACSADDFRRMQPALAAMARDLRTQLVLRAPDTAPAHSAAAATPVLDFTDGAVTDEKYLLHVTIAADGSAEQRQDVSLLINQPRGIGMVAQQHFSYNRSRESFEVLAAYTQKADGRRIPVAPSQIVEHEEPAPFGVAMFGDQRMTSIAFPDLETGDRVVYQVVNREREPLYTGHYAASFTQGTDKFQLSRFEFDLPEAMTLQADARGFTATAPVSANGRTVYVWEMDHGPLARPEANAAAFADYARSLYVSTFADYAELARVYQSRAADKVATTPQIAALARQLTAGLKQPREQAYAIDEWVRKNIRYVALYIGAGGVVPHSAESILANRYGDCKDHVVLMEALLTAAGIDSTPALINASNSFYLPRAAIGFSHVITYVPALDLYLDSTAEAVRPGYLPFEDVDKDVLLTKTGKLARTPATQVNTMTMESTYRIAADGHMDFSGQLMTGGAMAEQIRTSYQRLSDLDRQHLLEQLLINRGQHGSGSASAGDAGKKSQQALLTYSGQQDEPLALPGPVGLTASSLSNELGLNVTMMLQEKTRSQPFICQSADFHETLHYVLARGIQVLALPAPLAIHNEQLDYRSEYRQDADGIEVRRSLQMHPLRMLCSPADFEQMAPALQQVRRDLKAQLILQ